MQRGDEADEAHVGKHCEEKNNGRAVKTALDRERVEQPSDRRTRNVGNLEYSRPPGNRVYKMFGGHQVRQKRRTCRSTEGAAGANKEQHSKDWLHPMQAP